jgi:hypothetical protein
VHSEFWVTELALLVQEFVYVQPSEGMGVLISWFVQELINVFTAKYVSQKKAPSTVGVDSACKLKHVSLSIQRTKSWVWNRNGTVEVTIFTVFLGVSALFA